MHHNVVMALEGAHAAIDNIINRTRAKLFEHREAGGTDDEFVERLIEQFVAESQNHPAGAGAIHMALSVYRMTIQQEQIWELHDAVDMRDAALKTMWDIDEL